MFLKFHTQALLLMLHQLKRKPYHGIDLSNVSFDFEILKEMLRHHFISDEIITKEARDLIVHWLHCMV